LKAVIDEGVPRDLARILRQHGCDVSAFPNSWKGTKNGQLLAMVRDGGFGALLTCDRNLRHQQTIETTGLALVVLPAQKLSELLHEVPRIARALEAASPGTVDVLTPAYPNR
jgi:hypothetical protein